MLAHKSGQFLDGMPWFLANGIRRGKDRNGRPVPTKVSLLDTGEYLLLKPCSKGIGGYMGGSTLVKCYKDINDGKRGYKCLHAMVGGK